MSGKLIKLVTEASADAALPASVRDIRLARRTVRDGLADGRMRPIDIPGPSRKGSDFSGLLTKSRKVVAS